MHTEHRLISFDKTPLFYRHFMPQAAAIPKASVIIAHGLGEHGGRYEVFGEYLASAGFQVFAYDLRGFGRSGGKRACVKSFGDFHRDLFGLHSFVARNWKDIPVFLLGHSFGGLLTSSYLAFYQTPPAAGLILSSPLFGVGFKVPFWRHFLGIAGSYFLPDYSQDNRVPVPLMTHDLKIIHQYIKDPLVYRKISCRLYRELTRVLRLSPLIAAKITNPVLIIQAEKDFVVSKAAVVSFYEGLASQDKQIEICLEDYHEVLNETDKQKVFLKIGSWLSGHTGF